MSHTSLPFVLPRDANRPVGNNLLLRAGTFFVLGSLADLGLTIYMIRHPSDCFYESNPIAAWVLYTWGIRGLSLYKLGLVAFFCCIASVIASVRRDIARRLISSANVIVSCVIIYSLSLFYGTISSVELMASIPQR